LWFISTTRAGVWSRLCALRVADRAITCLVVQAKPSTRSPLHRRAPSASAQGATPTAPWSRLSAQGWRAVPLGACVSVCDFPSRPDALSSPDSCIRPQMAPKSPGTTPLNDVKMLYTWQLAESNKTATSAEGLATAHQSRHVAYAHPGTAVHQSSPWANARYHAHCAERVELHRISTILRCSVRLHPALCPPPPLPSLASRRASTAQRRPGLRLWHDQRHPDGERNAQLQCRPPPVC
jgi:hypothetical protein